jgi:peroxiredoxin
MIRLHSALMLATALTTLVAAAGEGDLPPVPSYQSALEAFQTERAKSSQGPKLSEADRAVMSSTTAELAGAMPQPGLQVGETAADFTLPNAFGKPVRLYDRLKNGPVVLSFYRGAWCPYCNLELKTLYGALPHFEALGAELITVTPQKPDRSLGQIEKDGYPFEILSDLDSSVMKAYRLHFEVPPELSDVYIRNFGLDLADYNGPGRYELPVPGTFVIDQQGVVRAAFADVDYRQRMEPAAIIAALEAIAARQADPR